MSSLIFGSLTTIDLVHYAAKLPSVGHKANADAALFDVGGPAANAAITAALLGSESILHTVLGDSSLAGFARTALAGHGVVQFDHGSSVDVPAASVWVDGSGERTILSTDNKRAEVLANADVVEMGGVAAVLLDGHYPNLQLALGRAAVAAGVPVVLDCGRWRPVYADLLGMASEAIMTESFRPPDMADLSATEAVQAIRDEHRLGLVAASRGAQGVLVADGAGLVEFEVPEVDVVDTLGAGDVLHGAYLHYRYVQDSDVRDALVRAISVASRSCQFRGLRQLANTE
jgi:sugar/nucleoside kinase (ribokinase family)